VGILALLGDVLDEFWILGILPLGEDDSGFGIRALGEFSFSSMIDTIHSPAAIENPCGNKVTLRRDFLRIAWPAGIITGKGPAAMTISSVANGELKALPANHGIY
jgi:hypothetical protein